MCTNEFGLDYQYFAKKMMIVNRDIKSYRPHELAREFARLSVTADSEVIHEEEFNKGLVENFRASLEVCKDLHKKIAELQLKLDKQKDIIEEQLSIIKIAKGADIPTTDMFTRYGRLEQKLDEQIAYSESFKSMLKFLVENDSINDKSIDKEVEVLLDKTSDQSLNKLKADAIRKAATKTLTTGQPTRHANYALKIKEKFFDYANQLLKEGE